MSQFPRTSPYEPLSVYDAPGVIASAIADGEITGETVRSALLEPEGLTPAERDTILTRFKSAAGGNPVAGALIDVIGNPWVWFAFLTAPAGMTALRAGKRIFDLDKRYLGWVAEKKGILGMFPGLTPEQEFRGTSVTPTMRQITDAIKGLNAEENEVLAKPFTALLEKLKLPHLDYERIANPAKRELAKRLSFALHGSLEGLDVARVERQVYANEAGEVVTREVNHRKKVAADLTQELRGMGGEEAVALRDAMRDAMNKRIRRVFSDDDAIFRVYRLISNPEKAGKVGMETAEGKDLVRMVMGDAYEAVQAGKMTKEQFTALVKESALTPLGNRYYMPKNLTDLYVEGARVPWEKVERGDIRVVKPAGAVYGRQVKSYLYDPDDLRYMRDQFGQVGETLDELITAGDEAARTATGTKPVRMLRINAERGLARYFTDTARTFAVTQRPGRAVLESQADELAKVAEAERAGVGKMEHRQPGLPEFYDPAIDGAKVHLRTPIGRATSAPMGGFSLADVLQYQWTHLKGKGQQERFQEILLPRAMGRLGTEGVVMKWAHSSAKDMARAFVETDVGKAIARGGEGGKDWIDTLKNWGEMPARMGDSTATSRGLAKYLYGTHLAGNIASVMLNSMQTFLHASGWLGTANVIEGWRRAIPEVWGYVKERAGEGFRSLTEAEKIQRYRKHFSHVNVEGVDLTGIAPTVEEMLEGRSLSGAGGQYRRPNWRDRAFEIGMAPFQTAEVLNRLVTAHAVTAAYEKAGKPIRDAAGRFAVGYMEDVRQAVHETQFGGDYLNTPWFMQKGWLANPLLRQFTNFMYRSATGLVETSRYIGGRSGGASIAGPFYDFARMMGTSALIYEVGKNVLGADLSRGLAFSAVTDIVPGFQGGRFRADESVVPLPPVFDIPWQMVKSVATGDEQLWRYALPRMIPGGVAIARALGGFPDLGLPSSFDVQQTTVGWDQMTMTPQGERVVPVFKADGTLLDWQSPSSLVLRSLGADLGQKVGEQGLDRYLAKQGKVISEYRRKAIDALIGGDMAAYQRVKGEFERRTGLPLTISKVQLDAAIRQREVPRIERTLDHIPADSRPLYQAMAAGAVGNRLGGVDVAEGATAGSRAARRPSALGLGPAQVSELQRTARAQRPLPTVTGAAMGEDGVKQARSFDGFEGF